MTIINGTAPTANEGRLCRRCSLHRAGAWCCSLRPASDAMEAQPAKQKKRLELQTNALIGEKGKIALTLPDGGPNRSAPGWTVPFV